MSYEPSAKRHRANDDPNPNAMRKVDVGFQSVKATLNGNGARAQNTETGGVLPPVSLSAHSAKFGDILFVLDSDEPNDKLAVRKLINGLDVVAAQSYPGDAEMQKLVLKQMCLPVGVAAEDVRLTEGDLLPELASKYWGLSRPHVVSARAGARLVYDLPTFSANREANTARAGDDQHNSYGFVLVAHDERTAANAFNKAASELVRNPQIWEAALAGYYGRARPWIAAVNADFRHCQTALILGIELLLKNKVLQVNPLRAELAGQPHEAAARIACNMGLTEPTNSSRVNLSAADAQLYAELAHQFADALYYTSNQATGGSLRGTLNSAVEFGSSAGAAGVELPGRHSDGSIKDDLIGSVVALQCKHTAAAVSAYAFAAGQVDRYTYGTAFAGAQNETTIAMMHR